LKKIVLLLALSGNILAANDPCSTKKSININFQKNKEDAYFYFDHSSSNSKVQYYHLTPILFKTKENKAFIECIKKRFPSSAYLSNTILIDEKLNQSQLSDLFSIIDGNDNITNIILRAAEKKVNEDLNKNIKKLSQNIVATKSLPTNTPPENKNTLIEEIKKFEELAFNKINSIITEIDNAINQADEKPENKKNFDGTTKNLLVNINAQIEIIKGAKTNAETKQKENKTESDVEAINTLVEEIEKHIQQSNDIINAVKDRIEEKKVEMSETS
jgi:hypothetical protein